MSVPTLVLLTLVGGLSTAVLAQDRAAPAAEPAAAEAAPPSTPAPDVPPMIVTASERSVQVDFDEVSLLDLVRWASDRYGVSFVLGDVAPLRAKTVTVLSHHALPAEEGWEVFLQAMEQSGYAVIDVGGFSRVVPMAEAAEHPVPLRTGVPTGR